MGVLLYFLLLLGSNLFLVGGLFVTRLAWRSDIEPCGLRSRPFQIMLHPEKFARPDRLWQIRLLNCVGVLLVCGAVAVLALDLF